MMNERINGTRLASDLNSNNNNMLPSIPEKNEIDDGHQILEKRLSSSVISIGPSASGEGPDNFRNDDEGRHVEFAEVFSSPSQSQDKIRRSGSMFVRISDTSVDQERMAEFDKHEKDDRELLEREEEESHVTTGEISPDGGIALRETSSETIDPSGTPLQIILQEDHPTPIPINTPKDPSASTSGGNRPKKDPLTNLVKTGQNSPRPKSALNRSRHVVEVLGRKVMAPSKRDKSPYACKIIEIPPEQIGRSNASKKIWVCQRDHKLLEDQLQGREKQKIMEEDQIANCLLIADPLQQLDQKKDHQKTEGRGLSSSFKTESMPLKLWPNFQNSQKSTETQTCFSSRGGSGGSVDQPFFDESDVSRYNSQLDLTSPFLQLHHSGDPSSRNTTPTPPGTSTTAEANPPKSYDTDFLEKMAASVETGIFTASETCSILINTVFKESLGNPEALERVLESKEFNDFLKSPNEIIALERGSALMKAASLLITDYLDAIKTAGISFPSNTNFARKSSEVVSVTSSKKNVTLAALQKKYNSTNARVWSFVPPVSPDKFQLALFLNPETGEIMQTITCQDHIFRTRYSTSPLESQIRSIISASREQAGLPAFVNPEYLLDTIVRCSSFAVTRLTKAKVLISRCSTKLTEHFQEIAKSKYTISTAKLNKLDGLRRSLQQTNIMAGIVYHMSSEMSNACKNIQNGLWNSMYVQDVLKFPRIPGFPNPRSNRECQIPCATKIPVQEAMNQLTEGIRSIDGAVRVGQFSVETLRFGVKLEKDEKKLIKDYIEGIKTLGSEKDVDYGSLLMTLLCSTEMINHFEDIMPSVDKFVRAAILTHLGNINWGTAQLLGIVKRMETDAHILAMRTTFKLRELKNRYRQEYGDNI